MPTTDNAYSLDGWRLLLENANGAVVSQDTADVPTGAGYACKLVVGSGNNGKFGIFSPIENKDMLKLRGGVCSLLVPLKCTAGLVDGTGKIRMAVLYFTGTADSVAGDPISSWGAEGTNPTLATNWNYASTPTAISVTTSWVDYKLENQSIPSNATNIAILIWSDDRATTTTTDILRIGGKVTLTQGASVQAPIVLPVADEAERCRRLYETLTLRLQVFANGVGNFMVTHGYRTTKRVVPTKSLTGASYNNASGVGVTSPDTVDGVTIYATAGGAGEAGYAVTAAADADL